MTRVRDWFELWGAVADGHSGGWRLPLSFIYDGQPSAAVVPEWTSVPAAPPVLAGRQGQCFHGRVGAAGRRAILEVTRFDDYPACEWLLSFENGGTADSGILEEIAALDYSFSGPLSGAEARVADADQVLPVPPPGSPELSASFVLHRTKGAPSDPTDFEVSRIALCAGARAELRAGGGRSSNHNFPFLRIDGGQGTAIIAVGWSGQWWTTLEVSDNGDSLRLRAGLEHARFYMKPGERVRLPRILILQHEGDRREANSRFRRLLAAHYVPEYQGEGPTAHRDCNTCFTRKGAWLNECNEANQIALIRALRPLHAEAVITDAGWFVGGWPDGAGNWDPDPAKYPRGMAPVAQAAQEEGMTYGLWFEPERVIAGTAVHRDHPEWVLWHKGDEHTGLLNFGLPEVQDYFFNIVRPFMTLPGLGVYRQDFNMDPLPWWLDNDEPNRTGITEMKYVEGLYAYWDHLATAFPHSFRENCASGGRRIDLEAVRRFHVHQKSDFWFDNATDQSSLFGLSQYLPNGILMTPIDRLDDTTFHSTLGSSLCLGWIADAPDFDTARASQLTSTHREVRHLLNRDWYPLTPFRRSTDRAACLGVQFNAPEEGEGIILLFRREACPDDTLVVRLAGLCPEARYRLTQWPAGAERLVNGAELAAGFSLPLPQAGGSCLIRYYQVRQEP